MREPARDLLVRFYPRPSSTTAATPTREELIGAIRAALGGPGVAVFEAMELVDATERGRIASLVQSELRRLKQPNIEPVLPRSTRTNTTDTRKKSTRSR